MPGAFNDPKRDYTMDIPCSGVILAGGRNSRFGGREKAFLSVGGKLLFERIYGVCRPLFDELILVTNNPGAYLRWDLHIVTDLFAVRSSLTGIHAGLFYASNPYIFVVACDTPFLRPEMVSCMLDSIDERFDAIMPETAKGREPLCAAYARRCLPAVERSLEKNLLKIQRVFRPGRIRAVAENRLRREDPELISFFNINTPQDLDAAERMLADVETEERKS